MLMITGQKDGGTNSRCNGTASCGESQGEKSCRAWLRYNSLMQQLNLAGADITLVYLLLNHEICGRCFTEFLFNKDSQTSCGLYAM
jgi:hypothetical protein